MGKQVPLVLNFNGETRVVGKASVEATGRIIAQVNADISMELNQILGIGQYGHPGMVEMYDVQLNITPIPALPQE